MTSKLTYLLALTSSYAGNALPSSVLGKGCTSTYKAFGNTIKCPDGTTWTDDANGNVFPIGSTPSNTDIVSVNSVLLLNSVTKGSALAGPISVLDGRGCVSTYMASGNAIECNDGTTWTDDAYGNVYSTVSRISACPSPIKWGGAGSYCLSNSLHYCSYPGQLSPPMLQDCGENGCVTKTIGEADVCVGSFPNYFPSIPSNPSFPSFSFPAYPRPNFPSYPPFYPPQGEDYPAVVDACFAPDSYCCRMNLKGDALNYRAFIY